MLVAEWGKALYRNGKSGSFFPPFFLEGSNAVAIQRFILLFLFCGLVPT